MAKAKRSSKKPARGKKGARRAPARKATRKATKQAGTKQTGTKQTATKQATPKQAASPSLATLARKIVQMSLGPTIGAAEIRALYQPDAVSTEATGQSVAGHAALEAKMKGWEQMTSSMVSKARHVWTGPHTICIEWDSLVTMRDGRTVRLLETAVHEIKDGKIQSERYYYNPSALAPPQGGTPGA